ncbi:polysaccharide pyruvyl transferase family protein [Ilumatobacter fluminis]|uniref:polysaccharide pyruvyl transferase family protein n=1 Tax=Ilumatobacter fluminis TaxID=467091 RepID=UPI001AAF2652
MLVERILIEERLAEPVGHRRLLTIGSILHFAQGGDTVWGSGINGKYREIPAVPRLDVRAVRGPLTRDALVCLGQDVPEVFGDPALLIGKYFPRSAYLRPNINRSRTAIVPNLHDWRHFSGDPRAVNPRWPVHRVLARIANSSLVVGSSLHGIIVAESFGIPARPMISRSEPRFKYEDYYLGTGRALPVLAASVDQAVELGGVDAPSFSFLELRESFPRDLWSCSTDPRLP